MHSSRFTKLQLLINPSEVAYSCLSSPMDHRIDNLVAAHPVVVFANINCCLCYVVKQLFFSLGVNPTIYEFDNMEPGRRADIQKALSRFAADVLSLPVIFIGGKLLGSLDELMTAHITGTLVPHLKEAGALWL